MGVPVRGLCYARGIRGATRTAGPMGHGGYIVQTFDPRDSEATRGLSRRTYAFLSIVDSVEVRAACWDGGTRETFYFLSERGDLRPIGDRAQPRPEGWPRFTPGRVTLQPGEIVVGVTEGGGKRRTPLVHAYTDAETAARLFPGARDSR